MLEHVPQWLGRVLKPLRAGAGKLAVVQAGLEPGARAMSLSSPAFVDGGRLPLRYTADGRGVSPPLVWRSVPEETSSLALIVEDPDAPAPQPLVHAIVWDLPPEDGGIGEGAIRADGGGDGEGTDVGRNSSFREGWLPPDPPTGHGEHRYVFQLFALAPTPDPGDNPGRTAILKVMRGNILAAGILTGTYSRGEPAGAGPATAAVPTR